MLWPLEMSPDGDFYRSRPSGERFLRDCVLFIRERFRPRVKSRSAIVAKPVVREVIGVASASTSRRRNMQVWVGLRVGPGGHRLRIESAEEKQTKNTP